MTGQQKTLMTPWHSLFWAVMTRDLKVYLRQKQDLLNPLFFFLVVVTLVPLAVGSDKQLLSLIAPGIIWLAALLSNLLALDKLFTRDYRDGCLEQMILLPMPLYLTVVAKIIAFWLVTGLPLIIVASLMAGMLFLPLEGIIPLLGSLLLGTPILSFIGAVGSGLVLPLQTGGTLLSLLILPLYIPLLIFATSTVTSALEGFNIYPNLALLGALFVFSLMIGPLATAAALRVHIGH